MTKRVSKWLISSKWGIYIPLLQGFFVKNIAKFYVYDFLAVLLKLYWLTFISSCPRELSRDLFSIGGKRKFSICEVFRAYFRDFSIFFHEIFMVAGSHRVLASDIKRLLVNALLSIETRLKVPILVILLQFWHFGNVLDTSNFMQD